MPQAYNTREMNVCSLLNVKVAVALIVTCTVIGLMVMTTCESSMWKMSQLVFYKDSENRGNNEAIQTPCMDPYASQNKRVEDLFCLKLPKMLPQFKNPCFYEVKGTIWKPRKQLRCLPYFYLLGVDKSGTTDLFHRIASHVDVRDNISRNRKEVVFWSMSRLGIDDYFRPDKNPVLYLHNYLDAFNNTSSELEAKNNTQIITADATPMYFWHFHFWWIAPQNRGKKEPEILTPHLLKYIYGDRTPKFIIQMREPADRLYSDYVFMNRRDNPSLFHKHVQKAIQIINDCLKTKSRRSCFFDESVYFRLPTRIHIGCYSVFLKEWLKVFPLSAFHVTRTVDAKKNMSDTLRGVFSHLDLAPIPDRDFDEIVSREHVFQTVRKKHKMLPETFQILREFYRPYLEETASLLQDKRFLYEDVYSKSSFQKSVPPN